MEAAGAGCARRPTLGARPAGCRARGLPHGVPGAVPGAAAARSSGRPPRPGVVAPGGVGADPERRAPGPGRRLRAAPHGAAGDGDLAGPPARRERPRRAAGDPGVERRPATSVLPPGAPVTVVVSRGAPTIPVPDLLGMSQADARTRLELDGLQLGTVTRRRTSDANPGTVVAQKPAASTLAAPGTVVDIVVARSPH